MFRLKDSFSEFVHAAERRSPCSEGITWFLKVVEENPNLNMEDGIQIFLDTPESIASEAWAIWILTIFYSQLTQEVRLLFLQKIRDPMSAFQLYIERTDLTEAEETLLKSIFFGRLPQAEKELREGKIKRGI